MTDGDDTTIGTDDIDALFGAMLGGDEPASGAPGWCSDLAVLVHAARAPAAPDELAGEADIVARMRQVRLDVGSGMVTPATVTDLIARRAAADPDRDYRAKHAAARLEMSRHPAVRTIGRVVAMKAAAVTTVAVISMAAAAATTGIVATVVVPALSTDEPRDREPAAATTTTTEGPGTTATSTPRAAGWADGPGLAACPVLPACPDAADPAGVPTEVAPGAPTTTAGSVPGERSTTTPTSTTTVPPATAPATTATTAPPTSTTVPGEAPPDPVGPLAADTPPGRGRSDGAPPTGRPFEAERLRGEKSAAL